MFRSARKIGLGRKLACFFWPSIGFRRAWSFQMLRLSRLKACPHKISLGFAAGAFASFLPLVGFHFLLAAAIAYILRGNIIASALGTVVGNPFTFPMIWYGTYKVGVVFTGSSVQAANANVPVQAGFGTASGGLWQTMGEAFWPMFIGAVPLGILCAALCYLLVYQSLRSVRVRARVPGRMPQSSVP